jgi:DNA-binding NarL/FixJ family response regulator
LTATREPTASILVVEDEPDHLAAVRLTLRLAGYEVWEAAMGEEALASFDIRRPDAVLLDIRLPGIDGLGVLEAMRASDDLDSLPVILCSAHAGKTAHDITRDDARASFVPKPFHPDQLLDALQRALSEPAPSRPATLDPTAPSTALATQPTRVLIVEDHSILTQSLSLTLRVEGMVPHVASALDEATVLTEAEALEADVVLLDLHLGAGRTSIPMIAPLVERGSRVLVLTGSVDEGLQGAALDAGAVAVLLKGDSLERLCQGIRDVAVGHSVMRPARRDELIEQGRRRHDAAARLALLSAREREVLSALAEGRSAEAIADEQFVALGTIRSQIRSILRKLGVNSQLAAVAEARRAGWTAS